MNRPPELSDINESRRRFRRILMITGPVVVLVLVAATVAVLRTRPGAPHTTGAPAAATSGSVPAGAPAAPDSTATSGAPTGAPGGTPVSGPAGARSAAAPDPHRANCAPRPAACGFPDAGNTGVPAGTQLMVVNGDMEITKAGTVIDGRDVHGCVDVRAANVTIRRSRITCTALYAVSSFTERYQGGGLLVEDTEIDCGHTNSTGVGSYGFTARRLNIHGCENGFDVDTTVTITDSYLHDFYEGATGHADGVQLAIGAHVVVSHNTIFDAIGTSAMISNGTVNSDVLVSGNLMAGGAYTLYCPTHGSAYRVVDNRFSTLYYPKGGEYGPLEYCDTVAEFAGNVWDSTLTPLASTG